MASTCTEVIAIIISAIATIVSLIIGILLLVPGSTSMGTNTAAGVTLVVLSSAGIVYIVVGGIFILVVECFSCMLCNRPATEPLTPIV